MTALVYALQPDQIYILMDTLVVRAYDKKPMCFQQKFVALPENNMVIAGTGCADLVNNWFSFVSRLSRAKDIDDLNELASIELNALSPGCLGSDLTTSTLYHFGYSKIEEQYVGYAYRSERGFQSEKLQYALGYKPVVPIEPDNVVSVDDVNFPQFLVAIVLEQQRRDRLLPVADKVGVGGEIDCVFMSEGSIRVETIHRFASYEADNRYIEQFTKA